MYQLLIVDDEPYITEGLYDTLSEWKEYELDITKAYSALEAMDKMERMKPDMILSDISMPGMDGLAFAERVKEQWPDCRFVFLTGFNHFEYVKAALQLDAVDFVLKGEGDEAVFRALRKAIAAIESEMETERIVNQARSLMSAALPHLQHNYLYELLSDREQAEKASPAQFAELDIPLQPSEPVILMVGRADSRPSHSGFAERMKDAYSIQQIVKQYMGSLCFDMPVTYGQMMWVWFLQPRRNLDAESWRKTQSFIHGTLSTVQKSIKQTTRIPVSFVLSAEPVRWPEIPHRFEEMILKLNKLAGIFSEALITDETPMFEPSSSDEEVRLREGEEALRRSLKKTQLLDNYLESGQREAFRQVVSDIFECVGRHTGLSYMLVREAFLSVSMSMLSYMNRQHLTDKIQRVYGLEAEKLTSLDSHVSWNEMVAYIGRMTDVIFRMKAEEAASGGDRVVQTVNLYIQKHLDGDLSMARLAAVSHFNPSYLSRLYKQVTGISVSDYIVAEKLKKSKEMLLNPELKINEISTRLGFATASYFTRFFKKLAGMTPQEFRSER